MNPMQYFARPIAVLLMLTTFAPWVAAQTKIPDPFPVKRAESRGFWYADGKRAIERSKSLVGKTKKAKNVILFIGDGMGISTLTASRILEGQLRGESGEENRLSFEEFPFVALSKTYSANQQTSDSAPTMSAIVTGVKTDEGVLSVDQTVVRGDHTTVAASRVPTILELAEQRGMSTGVVSTARLTHATPGACYAHTAHRDWEADADMNKAARDGGFADIARQLIEFPIGDGLEVAFGGGRSKFIPKSMPDPEYPDKTGVRLDGRDLPAEWVKRLPNSAYVWNKNQFDAVDPARSKHVLGLFEPSHMQYEHDRSKNGAGEPSLSEMTSKAIDIVSRNRKGFFLMVEGGRIDHAHHDGNAFRALTETIELSNAVRTALSKVDLRETLIIVTADHSHTFNMSGYPFRGNNILGLVRSADDRGDADSKYDKSTDGKPYTTLGYQNGPGAIKTIPRPDLSATDTTDPDFKQQSAVPLASETHGGEDVAIFAIGAGANLVHGVMEENWIFQVMREALRFPAP